jgi:guanine nucleotide-binding protein G(I)/G(S)/G(T) subunit beta-1
MAPTKEEYAAQKQLLDQETKQFKTKLSHEIGSPPKAIAPKCVRTMEDKDLGKVYSVAWSKDSMMICSAHQGGAFTIKKADNGGHMNLPHIFPKVEEKIVPMATCFLNNDTMIAVGGMDNVISLFNREQPKCEKKKVLQGHEGYISTLKQMGDKLLSSSGDSTCRLWDMNTGATVTEFKGHDGDCSGIDNLDSDPNIFVSSSTDTSCRTWDARTGKTVRVMFAKYGVNCISLFPTGTAFACGCDSASWELWSIAGYNQIGRGKTKKGRCEAIAISKSGAMTFMGWDAPEAGFTMCASTFKVDDQKKGEAGGPDKKLAPHTEPCTTMAIAPDGSALATGAFDATVKIWACGNM